MLQHAVPPITLLAAANGANSGADVPQRIAPYLSVQVAILMTLASLATFLAFIHSTAVSIQAPNVVLSVATELDAAIDQLYLERLGAPACRRRRAERTR